MHPELGTRIFKVDDIRFVTDVNPPAKEITVKINRLINLPNVIIIRFVTIIIPCRKIAKQKISRHCSFNDKLTRPLVQFTRQTLSYTRIAKTNDKQTRKHIYIYNNRRVTTNSNTKIEQEQVLVSTLHEETKKIWILHRFQHFLVRFTTIYPSIILSKHPLSTLVPLFTPFSPAHSSLS